MIFIKSSLTYHEREFPLILFVRFDTNYVFNYIRCSDDLKIKYERGGLYTLIYRITRRYFQVAYHYLVDVFSRI